MNETDDDTNGSERPWEDGEIPTLSTEPSRVKRLHRTGVDTDEDDDSSVMGCIVDVDGLDEDERERIEDLARKFEGAFAHAVDEGFFAGDVSIVPHRSD